MKAQSILLIAIATTAWSQVIVPTTGTDTFPACAASCPLLLQAQTSCLPPAAPVADQATYDSCFCQSALLQPLKSSPWGVCGVVCPTQVDTAALQAWYGGYCAAAQAPKVTTLLTTVTDKSSPTTTSATGTAATAAGATATTTNPPPPRVTHGPTPSWISTHWRWIVMIIVLIFGFTGLTFLLIYFKRRYSSSRQHQSAAAVATAAAAMNSRANLNRASGAGLSNLGGNNWGPQQHMAHTRGWDFADAGPPSSMREQPMRVQSMRAPTAPQPGRRGPPDPSRSAGGSIGQAI